MAEDEDEDEELDWDEWMKLTDVQMDAIVEREFNEYCRWLDSMTPPQRYRYDRDFALRSIRENRRRLRDPGLHRIEIIDDMWRKSIASSRLRLAKLRTWRATGTYPGEA